MTTPKRDKPATNEPYERFEKFAKALMAVPKKELDKQMAKDKRKRKGSENGRKH
jgi:hypothetical protein